ncbi:MAG TPA: redoxin domain-containing protein [Humisphaera sp.]|jgi:uncharacterized protein (TIGR03067 family)|nr:redoxin domain-containing protein [Humisphaera sp.]
MQGSICRLACLAAMLVGGAVAPVKADDGSGTHPPVSLSVGALVGALNGVWLADGAERAHWTMLSSTWNSTFTLKDSSFVISNFCGLSSSLTGKFTLNTQADPPTMDLNVDEKDMSEKWPGTKYPRCVLPGICKMEGGRFIICFQFGTGAKRPRDFVARDNDTVILSLAKVEDGFRELPKDIRVTVIDEQDKPLPHALVFHNMLRSVTQDGKPTEWNYLPELSTGADGSIAMKYSEFEQQGYVGARDMARGLTGFTLVSPASLAHGRITVKLAPDCIVRGVVACDALDRGAKAQDHRGVYINLGGRQLGVDLSSFSNSYKFEFHAPPGNYSLETYGEKIRRKYTDVSIPVGLKELQLPPISLEPLRLATLAGQPAPEFEGIVAWRGTPTKLSDLRGKFVLIDFWGYWCQPCVHAMPALIDLHRQFKHKGLAIISVHEDDDGEIATAAQLDEKIAVLKRDIWKGEDLPFPVALMSGKKFPGPVADEEPQSIGPITQYGIQYLPTLILIDREGKVVGEFQGVDFNSQEPAKKMVEAVKKLLGEP